MLHPKRGTIDGLHSTPVRDKRKYCVCEEKIPSLVSVDVDRRRTPQDSHLFWRKKNSPRAMSPKM